LTGGLQGMTGKLQGMTGLVSDLKFFYTVASCLDASNLSLASFDNNKAAGDRFGAASLLLSRASSVKQKQRDMQPSLYLFHT